MKILALDVSTTRTGWAVCVDGKITARGVIGLDSDKYGHGWTAFMLCHEVEGLVYQYTPDELAIEDVFNKLNYGTTKVLNRLAGALMCRWFGLARKEVKFYYAVSCRPTLGLKGNCQKEEVVVKVNEFFKFRKPVLDHNEADAIALAYHCWKKADTVIDEPLVRSFDKEEPDGLGIIKRKRK